VPIDASVLNRPPLVRSVLHPTDFSAASERAFANALAIALLRQTQLTLLHVHDRKSASEWEKFPPVRQTLERWGLLERGSAKADVYERLKVEVAKIALESAHPALAVTRYLDAHPHDLLVLATEGEAGLPAWFSRSTSEFIAGASRTAALFVPASAERGLVSLESGSYTLRSILVPIDRQPDAGMAIEFATRAAGIFGDERVSITLLHVGADEAPWPGVADGVGWVFTKEQRTGPVIEAILDAAERVEADVIVMPTAGEQGLLEMLRGSTTEQVLRRARCPVLAVPAARA
jgi:nucleotide-binding universal stress UspA family protein